MRRGIRTGGRLILLATKLIVIPALFVSGLLSRMLMVFLLLEHLPEFS